MSEGASVDLTPAHPAPPYVSPGIVLPHVVTDGPLSPVSSAPFPDVSPTDNTHSTYASDPGPDASAPAAADPATGWLVENPLASQGIVMPLSDCVDCGVTKRQVTRLASASGPLTTGGGGSGSGGGIGGNSFAPGPHTDNPVEVSDPTIPDNGGGLGSPLPDKLGPPRDGPGPPGDPGTPLVPIDPNGPGPTDPELPGAPVLVPNHRPSC